MPHFIFDCDGVLVDSEPLSMRIDVQILAENGVIISEAEAHRRFVGKTFAAMLEEMRREFGATFPADASEQKDLRLLKLYGTDLRAVDGVESALEALGPQHFSVASNSPCERVDTALRITGLTRFFGNRITSFEHVARGKPEPDVFIEAARRAGCAPEDCIVVEDSVTGVTAAHRAGCRVLGFTGTHPHPDGQARKLLAAGARTVFRTMAELPKLVSERMF
ncbi:HAD family phosphatase [Aestuariivirga sp.]|uniref:HAD family hydrolase n=1 Tax=Aestuariivirga sp. TaxID=2650926 RepID=UPI0025BDBD1D|nr:HAD family phosphatase [Aestuariivirga sp.]MCA3554734.1 HAD family phosphatase [Aestuariivirga sp.]